jgi:hypothetical protein
VEIPPTTLAQSTRVIELGCYMLPA